MYIIPMAIALFSFGKQLAIIIFSHQFVLLSLRLAPKFLDFEKRFLFNGFRNARILKAVHIIHLQCTFMDGINQGIEYLLSITQSESCNC